MPKLEKAKITLHGSFLPQDNCYNNDILVIKTKQTKLLTYLKSRRAKPLKPS